MKVLLVTDKDFRTDLAEDLENRLIQILNRKEHQVETLGLGRDNAAPCMGCLKCLTAHPGECVSQDIINDIVKKIKKYGLTIFLSPILFGHFSSTIANALDRGTGSHRWQIIIGFGNDVDAEEKSTFIDLTAKHTGTADIVHPGMNQRIDVFITQSREDNSAICRALEEGADQEMRI
jgi:multimeric flavodoxin WrbA